MANNEKVQDGRLRVDNVDVMISKGKREFNWLRIDANNNCNLKCTYCRVPRSTDVIPEAQIESFLNTHVASADNLQFGCGMEPTLDPRLSDLLLMASKTPAKPSKQYVVQTNGTLLHRHDHKKIKDAGLNRLSVSIDSLDPSVHLSQRGGSNINLIIRNLEQFQKNCPAVEVQFICVVTSANVDCALELATFARDFGAKRIAFRQMVYVPNHPNVVEADVLPLILPLDRFQRMKEEIVQELGDSLEMSFYDNEDLAKHRNTMRNDSYHETDADKPYQVPVMQVKPGQDLLENKKFFVIRGFMKSGTNWLCRLLNLHPDISCAGEFQWQNVAGPFVQNLDNSKLINQKPGLRHEMWMRLDRMMKECMVLANHPDAIWVGDRTPAHIAPSVILDSKIFNIIRDGRDVLISRAYHFFNYPSVFPKYAAMDDNIKRLRAFRIDPMFFIKNPDELLGCMEFVKESAYYWAEAIQRDNDSIKDLPPERVLRVFYEELHRNIESERTKLYKFLNTDPTKATELTFNTKPGFETEMPNRFLRKGQPGDWKNYMTPETIECFMNEAGEALRELGYDVETSGAGNDAKRQIPQLQHKQN